MSADNLVERASEDRRIDWGPFTGVVKWSHFMWIAGGLVAAGVIVNTFMWQQAETHHDRLWKSIHAIEERSVGNEQDVDVIMSRLDHFMDSRNYMMDIYRRDMGRMQEKLDRIEETVQQIEVDMSKLHQHQLP